jgi:hypothetical protein
MSRNIIFLLMYHRHRSRNSVVDISTGYGLDGRGVGVRVLGSVKNYPFSRSSRPTLGSTQPPIQWVPRALSTGVKRPGRESDHSPLTSGTTLPFLPSSQTFRSEVKQVLPNSSLLDYCR